MIRTLLLCCLTVALTGCAARQGSSTSASESLNLLLNEHVEQLLADSPLTASYRGDMRYNDQLEDISPAAIAAQRARYADRLRRLNAVSVSALDSDDRLNADLLRDELQRAVDGARFWPEQMPMDDRGNPAIDLPQMADRLPMNTEKDRADYVARLEKMPTLIDQDITQMRAGLAAGRVPPRVSLVNIVKQSRGQATAELKADPTQSRLYQPLLGRDPSDPLAIRARRAISDGIIPALVRLADFLESDYIPHCRESIAAKDSVDGIDWYRPRRT
jgi:uncharacterized protein (DUF885 family)